MGTARIGSGRVWRRPKFEPPKFVPSATFETGDISRIVFGRAVSMRWLDQAWLAGSIFTVNTACTRRETWRGGFTWPMICTTAADGIIDRIMGGYRERT